MTNKKTLSTPLIITAFGASVVEGTEGNNYESLLQAKLQESLNIPVTVHNRGIAGQTTAHGLGRIRNVLKETNPKYILITMGTNDVIWTWDLPKTTSNMDSIISICLNYKTKPILSTLTGLDTLKFDLNTRRRTETINSVYGQIAKKYNIPLVDLYKPLNGHLELFNKDGLHPNARGYQVITDKWHTIILQELKKTP